MIKIKPVPVTPQRFAGFGSVVVAPTAAPTSKAADYKFWSDLAHYQIEGETEIGICTVYRLLTTDISSMERHLHTPEILIPIDSPFILPLLRDGDTAEKSGVFRVEPGQAVVIDAGIWHGACLPAERDIASYFVIFKRHTPHTDVVKKNLPTIEII